MYYCFCKLKTVFVTPSLSISSLGQTTENQLGEKLNMLSIAYGCKVFDKNRIFNLFKNFFNFIYRKQKFYPSNRLKKKTKTCVCITTFKIFLVIKFARTTCIIIKLTPKAIVRKKATLSDTVLV